MPNPSPSKHAVFSFFYGGGFLDLGFEAAGFEVVFANEINKEFIEERDGELVLCLATAVPIRDIPADKIKDWVRNDELK